MATLDDSPSLYLGQQWTHWAEKVEGKSKNDHPSSKEECCSKDDGDTIKLRHQDMPLYGLCPARDEFYLVVCECCEQVVKPQALKRHIEQRHGHSSPRLSGVRKSKGSPGRHSGSPGRHGGSPARHTGSPGRHTSPKRDSHGKTPPINPPGMKNPSKSSSSSSHRSSTSNAKSSKKQSNHAMPVVKVERMQPSVLAAKSSSSSSTKISSTKISSTKVSSTKHDHSDKEHKHEKEHREHHKDHRDHSKEHKHDKDHKDHKEKEHREHHKDHREHNRDHKEKDHKHDKEHKDYKEKEHAREKEHKEHSKDREHKEKDHGLEKDHKQDRDRDHSKEKDHRDKDYSRDRDHKDKHDRDRERDRDKDRNRERDKERGKDREKDRDKDRERDREKEREKDRDKEREKDRDKEREKDSEKERDHKEKDHHHKDHREKKSLSNQNQSSSGSTSQTTSSVTPPRPSSSQKTSVSTPSPSTKLNASDLTSPSVGTSKPKFVKEKMLPCKDREFDANKHCGVWAPEDGRQCTRSLTCKTHALSLRRAVQGRRKPFDELLKEHRAAKEAFLKAKAEEKEAAAAAKAAGTTSLSTASSAKQSSSSSNSRETSKDTSTTASAAAKAAACNAMPVAKPSKVQLKVTSPTPSRPAPPPPPPPREEAPTNDRLSSDAEDDDDDRDRLGFPMLSFHPRPAAMNSFGARCYSGSSCIVFNRRADLLRAAFHACVERHLHPPPHKKLCVESKLPQGSNITTNTQDPYDFPAMESNPFATNGFPSGLISPTSSHNSLTSSWNSSKQSNKVKPKSSLSLSSASSSLSSPVSRNIRPKDVPSSKGAAITSPVAMVIGGGMAASLSSITPITPVTSLTRTGTVPASSMVNSTGVKRKRSGSGTVVGGLTTHTLPAGLTVNHHGTSAGNPISIAIPSGSLNLANLTQAQLNSINETISKVNAGGQHLLTSGQQVLTGANSGAKNHLLKDVNIMVTSRDPGVMNGQLVTTTAMPTSAIADIAHLQLNSLSGETNTLPQTHKPKKEKRLKLSHSSSVGHDGVNATMSTLTSLPGGVMVMPDLTGQQTFTQAFGSTGLLTTSTDFTSSKLSPSTTSPLFASGSASPQTSTGSPLPNGMLGPGLELKVKGLPVNHVAGAMMVSPGSASSTPSPSTASADSLGLSLAQQQSLQHRSKAMRLGSVSSRKSSGSRSKSHSKTQQLAPQVAASQQLTAAAITLTSPGNRLLSTTTLPMYTMDASSGQFQHIQIQPKATGKQTLATGKLSMQPMSLTIPMAGVSVTSPQQQAHATLLLQNDDHQRELSGAHHAAAAQQLQNSPSNVLS